MKMEDLLLSPVSMLIGAFLSYHAYSAFAALQPDDPEDRLCKSRPNCFFWRIQAQREDREAPKEERQALRERQAPRKCLTSL